jgi:hypothetical protein
MQMQLKKHIYVTQQLGYYAAAVPGKTSYFTLKPYLNVIMSVPTATAKK